MKGEVRQIQRRPVDSNLLSAYPEEIDPLLARVFAARQVGGSELDLSLAAMLPVSELEGTGAAAERLLAARMEDHRVVVVGDFDADGATATALVMTCLRAFGFRDPAFIVPDRQRFGYGLSAPVVELVAELDADVLVTVDNGISSHAGVARARELDIDVIVTDHHLPGATEPDATVLVNPNARDSVFPSKALSGVGVAFYVMAALGQRMADAGLLEAADARAWVAGCLDYVALGTVADLVPLDRNNRVLVNQGLQRIRAAKRRPGLDALFAAAGRNPAFATTGDLGFAIAPRLNAAGRLTDMTVGINCLLAQNPDEARRLANELDRLNNERKRLQAEMQESAEMDLEQQLASAGDADAYCLYKPDWHQGVVGLVATRLKEALNRPVIAFAPGERPDVLKGSGRSVGGVHLRDVLAAVDAHHPGVIERFGGHAMAAGLSLNLEQLDRFREAFANEVARWADRIDDSAKLMSDGVLGDHELTLGVAETLRFAAPWGQAFPEPRFDGEFIILTQRVVGQHHLKLRMAPANGDATVEAIAFNQPPMPDGCECVRLLYRLDVNEFRNRRSPQLVVEYMECV